MKSSADRVGAAVKNIYIIKRVGWGVTNFCFKPSTHFDK